MTHMLLYINELRKTQTDKHKKTKTKQTTTKSPNKKLKTTQNKPQQKAPKPQNFAYIFLPTDKLKSS